MIQIKKMKNKIEFDIISIIKFIAFIMVFMLHSKIFSPPNWNTSQFSWIIYTPAWASVWIFIILSGYGTGVSFIKGKYELNTRGIMKYCCTRLVKILPIYFLYLAIILPIYFNEVFSSGNTILELIKLATLNYEGDFGNLYIGNAWYLSTLIKLYLLAPLIFFILEKIKFVTSTYKKNLVLIIVLIIGMFLRLLGLRYYYQTGIDIWSSEIYVPFYMNIDIFTIGFISAYKCTGEKQNSEKSHAILFLSILVGFCLFNSYIYYFGVYTSHLNYIHIYQYIFPSVYALILFMILRGNTRITITKSVTTVVVSKVVRFYTNRGLLLYLIHSNILMIISNCLQVYNPTLWIDRPFYSTICLSVLSLIVLASISFPLQLVANFIVSKFSKKLKVF